ncbi:alpha/beta fold hydrolase [Lampropedia puyangensis]|uniref:Alpha/beta fold hydrolase n=1 Tax=Lampropedia puyangensis TaxID=1330072 RepID=A0A4V4GQB8_9BURK|nr:YqiA/YcfP family alpha/beta fold hydrolase [Lampropedia puyangensis]THT97715.1 alpha/beta fold hydrolase [Lampropedia puyangensis]
MKPEILFVHGFMSGVQSSKWLHLQTLTDRYTVNIFEVDYRAEPPYLVLNRLVERVRQLDQLESVVVAHSLGCFFTRLAQLRLRGFSSILLNPSFKPSLTLFNGGERSMPAAFQAQYEQLEQEVGQRIGSRDGPETALIELGDEVVDQPSQLHFFEQSALITLEGGSHSFEAFDLLNQHIERGINMSFMFGEPCGE